MIIRLIGLIIRVIQNASIKTEPTLTYNRGIGRYDKDFFDDEYPFQFYKSPIDDFPNDIEYFQSHIGEVTLKKLNSYDFFEIYETNIISDKELAMNVRLSYGDLVQTGISSQKESVVTKTQFFVLFINDKLKQLEVKSSIQDNITDKNIKKEFGEYLIKHLKEHPLKQINRPRSYTLQSQISDPNNSIH